MAKVLISFLGTGGVITNDQNVSPVHDKEPRQYRTTNYYLGDKFLGEYSFVSLALRKEFKADKAIMIGTTRSMWEEVYSSLKIKHDPSYQAINDDIYFDIADYCENSSYQSDLFLPHQDKIEEELGKESHVVLIKYGLDESEIQENINRILSLEQFINNGDELIIDITHSFRSLPILITQLMLYLKTISKKKITISHLFYGMLDITKEMNNRTPIVDLASVININDWIIGAYSLQNYGNGTKISELIKKENKNVSTLISDFSNAMNLNHILAIQSQVQRLAGIKNVKYSSKVYEMILSSTITEFVNSFKDIKKESVFELYLAEWQAKHHNYAAAYISIIESIVSYVCEINDLDSKSEECRNKAKEIIHKNSAYINIKKGFISLNENRKKVAHSLEATDSIVAMINELNDGITYFKQIIK